MAFPKRQITYSEHPNRAARAAHAKGEPLFRTYDTSAIEPKRSKWPVVLAIIIAIVIVVALGFGINAIYQNFFAPSDTLVDDGVEVSIVVEDGEGAGDIAESLVEGGLISKTSEFTNRVSELDVGGDLKPGSYTFTGGTSVDDIIAALQEGPEAQTLTVPEGSTVEEIAASVDEFTEGRVSSEDFVAAASDASAYADSYDFLEDVGSNSLEGFLFPKTYEIEDDDTAETIIYKMLSQFQTETADLDWSYAEKQGLSIYDAVNLASIVECESTDDAEVRADVASVFYNRLNNTDATTHGYLQSDATTAYEVGHDPTSEDLDTDSDYNTYTNEGLPPTPICSPGLASLQAVCEPADTDYYFFYFEEDENGDMQYYFSETYEEHQKNYS